MTEEKQSYFSRLQKIKLGQLPKEAVRKTPKPLKRISDKKKENDKIEKEARGDGDTELQKWFRARMKQMGDHCYECGCKVEHKIYQYAIMSICHILAKRKAVCPSVATNPYNWITLCPDHHQLFDSASWEEKEMMGCWDIVKERLIAIYPSIAIEERRHFPESVLKIIEKQ